MTIVEATSASTSSSSYPRSSSKLSIRLPGRPFEGDDDVFPVQRGWKTSGLGREFDLFDTRGGQNRDDSSFQNRGDDDVSADETSNSPITPTSQRQRVPLSATRSPLIGSSSFYPSSGRGGGSNTIPGSPGGTSTGGPRFSKLNTSRPSVFQSVQGWWTCNIAPAVKNLPRFKCRVEPSTTIKIRKQFKPFKTVVRLGADFNTQLGVWQFKSSWEDAIIGGKITLAGKELQLSKSWQLSVGAVEDLVTRLRFRAAVDLSTWKAYARIGFRTERLSPINIMEGFTLLKQLPLDGNKGNVKLEVKANFALPEPEIEYSTESHRSLVGMGDIEVNIDELNLVLDY
ncbi:expressed unknown protein [Seminavis robusta]|uniref:Uncharacterized protein n=1 Tax=Seminavis robusta TaxID=568900 RepID=A0A9N8EDU7_9STRA|nr:expressed unknown protein [Seminavis robusta]|eukprot:Sro797_g203910.1 n/a (342) ;mRNA; f:37043-38258